MSDRFTQIADELKQLFIASMSGEIVESEIQSHIKGRRVLMTPEGGWEGKNAEMRQAAQDRAELEDVLYQGLQKRLLYCHDKQNAIKAEIDSLIAERRALEWQIRRAMVVQMAAQTGTAVDFDSEDATDVQPFEAFIDKASLRAMFEPDVETDPETPENSPAPDLVAENEDLSLPPIAHDAFDQHMAQVEDVDPAPVTSEQVAKVNPFITTPEEQAIEELDMLANPIPDPDPDELAMDIARSTAFNEEMEDTEQVAKVNPFITIPEEESFQEMSSRLAAEDPDQFELPF